MALEQLGRLEDAAVDMRAVLAEDPQDDAVKGSLGHVYALARKHAAARKMLADLAAQADAKDVEFFAALICAGLKDKEGAITWLERAVEERSGPVRYRSSPVRTA
jgi:thioredoxin-like negative regulator of GroEL